VTALESELRKTTDELEKIQQSAEAPDMKDKASVRTDDEQQAALHNKISLLQHQIRFFNASPWRRAMDDLLTDNGSVSFHRFQMCVWTLVLGIIFITEVWTNMAMPDFNATLLGLMGVSAGTFIGFKIPEPAKA